MMPIVAASGLTFDAERHEYRYDGRVVPSVTHILAAVGVSADFEAIGAMSARLREQIELRRQLGTAVHADCHAFDDDDLNWATVDARVAPFIHAWATFRENKQLRPVARERRVYHPGIVYAGTLDGIFIKPDDRRVLVDIKIGDPKDAGCAFQTAAYEAAYLADFPDERIDERWGVQLVPECSVPYRISPYTDWRDFAAFQAFVTTYGHQAARRSTR